MANKRDDITDLDTIKVTKEEISIESSITEEVEKAGSKLKKIPLIAPPLRLQKPSVIPGETTGKMDEIPKKPCLLKKPRYETGKLLGVGGSGKVYSVKDCDLQREIAVKITKIKSPQDSGKKSEFANEARVLAGLQHPNVIPVYDIDINGDDSIYFSMQKIHGESLSNLLKTLAEGKEAREIASIEDILRIILKVCDVLEYAHSQKRLHQDIKPDNIMVGRYGEVFLIDWGSSSTSVDDEVLHVTPGYMSPEQARGEDTDKSTDIYSLGATLFHLLYHRFSTSAKTLEEMLKKKSKGTVDPLTEAERKKVPPPLEAIVMKALEFEPGDRYQHIEDMAQDIKNFQSGFSVSVYRDTLLAFFGRWYKRNRRGIWYTLLIVMILVASGTLLWREKLKEIAYWGNPKYTFTFKDKSWKKSWHEYWGKFTTAKNGGIISDGTRASIIIFKKKLCGSTAVELEAEMMKGYSPGDLSLIWYEDIKWKNGSMKSTDGVYYFQTGCWDNSFCMIQHPPQRLSMYPKKLTIGKKYTIRIEIDVCTLRLFLDGKKICEYTRYLPFDQGYVGIYAFHRGKYFNNVKIFSKGVPEQTGILAIGDEFFRRRDFAGAAEVYEKIAYGISNEEIKDEALFRYGISLFMADKTKKAFSVWAKIKGEKLRQNVKLYRIREQFRKGDYTATDKELRHLYLYADSYLKTEIELEWARIVGIFARRGNRPALRRFIKIQQKLFPDKQRYTTVQILLVMGAEDIIVKDFRDFRQQYITALINRGEINKAISVSGDLNDLLITALRKAGRYDEILKRFPDRKDVCSTVLLDMKRYEEMLEKYPDQKRSSAIALLRMGKYNEILKRYPHQMVEVAIALIKLNKPKEVINAIGVRTVPYASCLAGDTETPLEKYPENIDTEYFVMGYRAIDEYFKGNRKKSVSMLKNMVDRGYDIPGNHRYIPGISRFFFYCIPLMIDMKDSPDGKLRRNALRKMFEIVKAKHRYSGYQHFYYLLALLNGEIDKDEFFNQEVKSDLDLEYDIYRILDAEYNGDKKRAIELYKKLDSYYQVRLSSTLFAEFVKRRLKQYRLLRESNHDKTMLIQD